MKATQSAQQELLIDKSIIIFENTSFVFKLWWLMRYSILA